MTTAVTAKPPALKSLPPMANSRIAQTHFNLPRREIRCIHSCD